MNASERPTTSLLDEYDGTLRRIIEAWTKQSIATDMRKLAGRFFTKGEDIEALVLRSYAESLEREAEETKALEETLEIIYGIIRERHGAEYV